MPRYFFDVWHSGNINRDVGGIDLPDRSDVREIASPMEQELAAVKLGLDLLGGVSVVVRDACDAVVYRSECRPSDPVGDPSVRDRSGR